MKKLLQKLGINGEGTEEETLGRNWVQEPMEETVN